jgi:hypothetical protein
MVRVSEVPEPQRPLRPQLRGNWDDVTGEADPADRTAVAHATAAAVVRAGREGDADPARTSRLVCLVDEVGLDELAELWQDSEADTLPGTLWSLYLLRTWLHRDGVEAARLFDAGRFVAEVSSAVAGVAEPPGPDEVAALGDAVLTSAFDGDFAVALERAGAFCRVISAGRAHVADAEPDSEAGERLTRLAGGNLRMAEQLEHAAQLWRRDALV